MSKALGIDYGDKRLGIAVSDGSGIIAFGLQVIENKGTDYILETLKNIISENNIEVVVVGVPKSLSGDDNNQSDKVHNFIKLLEDNLDIKIYQVDERYTSKMSAGYLREKKSARKVAKGDIDIESAKIILQEYLDKNK